MKNKLTRIVMVLFLIIGLAGCSVIKDDDIIIDVEADVSDKIEKVAEKVTDLSEQEETIEEAIEETKEEDVLTDYEVEHQLFCENYYYDKLNDDERKWYIDMYRSITQFEMSYSLNEKGVELKLDLDKVFQSLLNDHPEIFYVDGYEYTEISRKEELIAVEFSPRYNMNEAEIEKSKVYIDSYVNAFLKDAPIDGSDYEKVKYIYECIILNTDYVVNAVNNQNLCSVFITRESVCQGYAKAFMYLATELEIECIFVVGQAGGEGHAWNMVCIDGNYYHVDATWGDSSYLGNDTENATGHESINYDYLCIPDYEITFTHTIDTVASVPTAIQIDANYYVQEGTYFWLYDREQLKQKIEEYRSLGRVNIQIKAANSSVYSQMKEALFQEQEIFDYLPEHVNNINYSTNDILLTINLVIG